MRSLDGGVVKYVIGDIEKTMRGIQWSPCLNGPWVGTCVTSYPRNIQGDFFFVCF